VLERGIVSLAPKMNVANRGDAYPAGCFRRHWHPIHEDMGSYAVTCATPPRWGAEYHR
jgi:hypothetical protein